MYKKFHSCLLNELSEELPEDLITYLNIRKPGLSANPNLGS